jgi:hypothetical protein
VCFYLVFCTSRFNSARLAPMSKRSLAVQRLLVVLVALVVAEPARVLMEHVISLGKEKLLQETKKI